jgi:hypothetical protein
MPIQSKEANRLFNPTTEEEKRNCNHSYEKEYYLGGLTDDYAYTKWGDMVTEDEYRNRKSHKTQ